MFEFPIQICELSKDSKLHLNVYNMASLDEAPLASTVIDLFDPWGQLRQGTWDCVLYPG